MDVSVTVFVRTLNGFIVAFASFDSKVTLRLFAIPLNLIDVARWCCHIYKGLSEKLSH